MINIPYHIKNHLIYTNKEGTYIYADYTGTGQATPIIENHIIKNVLPYYSNVHSNSKGSHKMTHLIDKTKEYIRKVFNLKSSQKIIFTGNGTTGAINHLVNSIDYTKYKKINVIITLYEHYSNHIPWVEIVNKYKHIKLTIIPLTADGEINYDFLFKTLLHNNNDLNIVSITGCSNVSGIITDIPKIKNFINNIKNTVLFVDYATLAPYKTIDCSMSDACFISPHKFLGGYSTPGILIAEETLFMNTCPYAQGGGCVKLIDNKFITYDENLETRETAGTPNIIGIIKIKFILAIKDLYIDTIQKNEQFIIQYIHSKLSDIISRHRNLSVLFLNKSLDHRLPIICINIKGCHHNDIVTILNVFFGIQTRGGISCCGLLAMYIKKKLNIDGWCRITFHWIMSLEEINYILYAIEYITKYHQDLNKYKV